MKLSDEILKVFEQEKFDHKLTFGEFIKVLTDKGFYFLILIFALPPALPIPAPGFAIPFGLAIILLATQLLRGRKTPWFPQWLLNFKLVKADPKKKSKKGSKKLKPKRNTVTVIAGFLRFFERFVRPRFLSVSKSKSLRVLHLGLVVICGCSMLIPLPLTNTAPAFGVFVSSLGLMEDDGLVFGIGVLGMLAGLTLSAIIVGAFLALGNEGVSLVRSLI
jgi:hypothetical protein